MYHVNPEDRGTGTPRLLGFDSPSSLAVPARFCFFLFHYSLILRDSWAGKGTDIMNNRAEKRTGDRDFIFETVGTRRANACQRTLIFEHTEIPFMVPREYSSTNEIPYRAVSFVALRVSPMEGGL